MPVLHRRALSFRPVSYTHLKWDVLGEMRMLYTEQSDITETGALLAVYRHAGNNAKIGLGYEWGKVSDDPAKINYVGQGIFLNLISKF